ncbi:MAG: hypothetical protein IJR14_10040, partial [Synergistaceae bacterium]|nr:hypothetical protein [Synergistaceae bacterium]
MSFEVFKSLDPTSISIALTSSDCNRLGSAQDDIPRRIAPSARAGRASKGQHERCSTRMMKARRTRVRRAT